MKARLLYTRQATTIRITSQSTRLRMATREERRRNYFHILISCRKRAQRDRGAKMGWSPELRKLLIESQRHEPWRKREAASTQRVPFSPIGANMRVISAMNPRAPRCWLQYHVQLSFSAFHLFTLARVPLENVVRLISHPLYDQRGM